MILILPPQVGWLPLHDTPLHILVAFPLVMVYPGLQVYVTVDPELVPVKVREPEVIDDGVEQRLKKCASGQYNK